MPVFFRQHPNLKPFQTSSGYRPLDGSPIVTKVEGSVADVYNFELNHEHFFFDDGKDLFGEVVSPEMANIGYREEGNIDQYPDSGIFSEDASSKNYRFLDDYYDDDLLREAILNIVNPGEWSTDAYRVFWGLDGVSKRNCQDFVAAVRSEYARLRHIIEIRRVMQDTLDYVDKGVYPVTIRQRY